MTFFLVRLSAYVLSLPRVLKRLVALAVDMGLCVLSVWLAYYLRLGEFVDLSGSVLWAVGASISLALPVFILSGLYRAIFRYSGWTALMAVIKAICAYGLIYAFIFMVIGVAGVPRTLGILQPILLLLLIGASRTLARFWLGDHYLNILKIATRPKVLIYGAGQSGRQLVAAMANNHDLRVVGFLDDDDRLYGNFLNGLPIFNPADLSDLAAVLNVSDVLLAMPRLSRNRRNEILAEVRKVRVAVRTIPSVTDLAQGKVSIADIRELDIDDLLGRDPVRPDDVLLTMSIRSKIVMVTGAGGSIGSELCRQILAIGPSKLLLIEHSEFALYDIHHELDENLCGRKIVLVPLLASVQDYERMREIMSTWCPNTVYHAAAYKHVPLVEHNPAEGIKNNVLGTWRTAQAAADSNVSDFVLISTDKAVRPTNIMGASKRLAEMVLQALAIVKPDTRFSMVRFGNVLGSSGSVVPKFRQQIQEGGPITLTDPEVTRFFMTIPEAAQLVIQAGAMAKGGDVFILDMGEPVKIMDLALRMIELSGLTLRDKEHPDGDIEIKTTGLRPGEKLYEELLIGNNPKPTSHQRIMTAHEGFMYLDELEPKLHSLHGALNTNDVKAIRLILMNLVEGYAPSSDIVDWIYLEHEGQP